MNKKKGCVYESVTGSKYVGEFEADTAEEAIELSYDSDGAGVSLCWSCSSECEDGTLDEFTAEEVE